MRLVDGLPVDGRLVADLRGVRLAREAVQPAAGLVDDLGRRVHAIALREGQLLARQIGTAWAAAIWKMRSTDAPSSRSISAVTTRCTEVSSHAATARLHAHARPQPAGRRRGSSGSAAGFALFTTACSVFADR